MSDDRAPEIGRATVTNKRLDLLIVTATVGRLEQLVAIPMTGEARRFEKKEVRHHADAGTHF